MTRRLLDPAPRASTPDPTELAVLRLLASGATDETAARRLGMSVRSLRRRVAHIMGMLEATSRFEAGVRAAERGWVGRPPHGTLPRRPALGQGASRQGAAARAGALAGGRLAGPLASGQLASSPAPGAAVPGPRTPGPLTPGPLTPGPLPPGPLGQGTAAPQRRPPVAEGCTRAAATAPSTGTRSSADAAGW